MCVERGACPRANLLLCCRRDDRIRGCQRQIDRQLRDCAAHRVDRFLRRRADRQRQPVGFGQRVGQRTRERVLSRLQSDDPLQMASGFAQFDHDDRVFRIRASSGQLGNLRGHNRAPQRSDNNCDEHRPAIGRGTGDGAPCRYRRRRVVNGNEGKHRPSDRASREYACGSGSTARN